MNRRKPLRRKANLRPKTPNPRRTKTLGRNRKRAAENHARAYGSYADAVRAMPCVACGLPGTRGNPIVAAHTKSGGTGRKADARWLIPLHDAEHRVQHDHGWSALPTIGSRETAQQLAAMLFTHYEVTYGKN